MNKESAKQNLIETKDILDGLGIHFFLSNGTLLGYYRDGDIIEHDRDIDLGIDIRNFDNRISAEFIKNGFDLRSVNGAVDNGLEYSFMKRDVGLDIFFYYNTEHTSWMAVWMREERKRVKYVYPLINGYKKVEFLGKEFFIPANTEEYLKAQYGEWQIPVEKWDCFSSPNNIEKDYWQIFYRYPHTLEPSAFARSLILRGKKILDMGCGNGRDTYFFEDNNDVLGIDQYVPETGPFRQIKIEEFLKESYKSDVLYCRFLFHAISEDLQNDILDWARHNVSEVYIECRSDKGVIPDYTHDRRLVNSERLLRKCLDLKYNITYFIEDTGLAVYENEDPVIIRLHLRNE